jgi:pimeloyl-ACP methyl ester carboxylesterase
MLSLVFFSTSARAAKSDPTATIVLVHGAFASPAGWDGVADALHRDGYQTAAPALGLASVSEDVAIVRSTLDAIPGDKILVGHSYGGFVITNAASGRNDVRGLVYTAAYVPDSGETITSLSVGYTPGAFLAHLVFVPPSPFAIVDPQFFPEDFAQDLNPKLGAEIAAQQRPTSLASSSPHPAPPHGTRCRRGTQSRPTTAPSTRPCSGSWPSALDRRRSGSPPRATWAASPTTRRGS